MSSSLTKIMGFLTLLAPVVFLGVFFAIAQSGPMATDTGPDTEKMNQLTIVIATASIYIWALVICCLVFIFRVSKMPGGKKTLWTFLLLCFHAFALPFFWYRHIRLSAYQHMNKAVR
jgi:hypothetical protein